VLGFFLRGEMVPGAGRVVAGISVTVLHYAAFTEMVAGAPVGVAVLDVPPCARTVQVLPVVVEAAKYQV